MESMCFSATLLQPAQPETTGWYFLLLPKAVSEKLPRRGRTSVSGTINEQPFQQRLEPDGQLSHWLKVSEELAAQAGISVGDKVTLTIAPVAIEPEPELPADLQAALADNAAAWQVWQQTSTLARVDWLHWLTSAKQAKTRQKRIDDACQMLAAGKRRVCCFDPSGFYSKAFRAPQAAQ